jgi:hypothetical protein
MSWSIQMMIGNRDWKIRTAFEIEEIDPTAIKINLSILDVISQRELFYIYIGTSLVAW